MPPNGGAAVCDTRGFLAQDGCKDLPAMVLGAMAMAGVMMRVRVGDKPLNREVVELNHLKDISYLLNISYLLSCLGFFVDFLWLYVLYYYINFYAFEVAGTDPNLAFYLLALLNAWSFFGRLLPNYLARHIGLINIQIIAGIAFSALAFALLGIKSTPGGCWNRMKGAYVAFELEALDAPF